MKILAGYADWGHNEQRKKLNTYGGIGYYRTVKPLSLLNHDVRIVGKEITHYGTDLESQWDEIFKEFDIFATSYFADDRAGAAIIYHARKHGKKLVLDIDDNYLDVPESNLAHEEFKPTKSKRAFLSTILSFADAITVSTEPLKERIQGHIKELHGIDKPCFVIPNMNDVADWNFPIKSPRTDRFTIGYSGSNSHQDDLQMVMPSIAKVMNARPHVHFELIGSIAKDKIPEYFGRAGFTDDSLKRIHLFGATATFKEFPEYLLSMGWHVGIAPLVDTAFTRSKSHIKWMEYSMAKIPTVASKVYPYYMDLQGRETITDGETGFLCKPNDWVRVLSDVIDRYPKHVGEQAYEHVKKNWQYTPERVNEVYDEIAKLPLQT